MASGSNVSWIKLRVYLEYCPNTCQVKGCFWEEGGFQWIDLELLAGFEDGSNTAYHGQDSWGEFRCPSSFQSKGLDFGHLRRGL